MRGPGAEAVRVARHHVPIGAGGDDFFEEMSLLYLRISSQVTLPTWRACNADYKRASIEKITCIPI